jgi:hypothetical protein
MAITLTTDPASGSPATNPVVVSDCLQWCLQPDVSDVLTTPGTFATVLVNFPSTISSIPANGTEIVIWGHTFTVNSALGNSTANAFKISSSGNITGAAFRQMLNANIFFAQNTVIDDDDITLRNTVVVWNQCGEQANFSGANMDLSAITALGGTFTVTNGTTPVQTDGYTMQTRLFKVDAGTNVASPVTEFEGLKPLIGCDEITETCVNYIKDAARLLFTPMPDLSTTSEIDPEEDTLTGRFLLQYGWNYKDANCQPLSGNFYPSDEVFVVNAAFDTQNKYGIAPYWQRHPDFPIPQQIRQKFLTNQPTFHRLSEHSFAWLWFLNPFTGTNYLTGNGTGNPFTLDHFDLFIEIYENGSAIVTDDAVITYPACQWYQVMNFNVSPQTVADESNIGTLVSEIGKYTVIVKALNSDSSEFAFVSEEIVFGVEHDCGDNIRDVYFLTPQGGIGTLLCEITESEIVQEGTEICLDTPCATSRLEAAKYGGRQLSNLRSYDRVTIKSREQYGEQWREYFRSFKASPDRYIMVKEEAPNTVTTYLAKRFNPEPGGIKIFQTAEYIDMVATGTLSDIPVQSPKNAA